MSPSRSSSPLSKPRSPCHAGDSCRSRGASATRPALGNVLRRYLVRWRTRCRKGCRKRPPMVEAHGETCAARPRSESPRVDSLAVRGDSRSRTASRGPSPDDVPDHHRQAVGARRSARQSTWPRFLQGELPDDRAEADAGTRLALKVSRGGLALRRSPVARAIRRARGRRSWQSPAQGD